MEKEKILIVDRSEVQAHSNGTSIYDSFGQSVTFLDTNSGIEEKKRNGIFVPEDTVVEAGCSFNDFTPLGDNLYQLIPLGVGKPLLTIYKQDFWDHPLSCGEHSAGVLLLEGNSYHFCSHLISHSVDFEYFSLNLLFPEAVTVTMDKHLGYALQSFGSFSKRFGRKWAEIDLSLRKEVEGPLKGGPERV